MADVEVISKERDDEGKEEEELLFPDASFFHPSRLPFKLILLFLICFLCFHAYFCFDNPSALQRQILTDMDVTVSDYTILYSVYSWPNVILAVFGGFLVDAVFGIRLGTIIFSLLVTVGQALFGLGALFDQYWLMIFGRFVVGLGGENVAVCQNMYAAIWFKGPMLNLVFGLQLSIARMGGAVNLWSMQPVYNAVHSFAPNIPGYVNLGITLFTGCIVCLFSLTCAFVVAVIDRYGGRVLKRKEKTEKATCADLKEIAEVRHFSAQVWLICAVGVFYYAAIFPFIGVAQTFYVMKYDFPVADANTANSLAYFIPLLASPIFGFVVDLTGRNVFWVIFCCLITAGAHIMIAFTFITPFVCTAVLGIADAIIASSLWPLLAYAAPEKNLGTAYGVMQAGVNLGLAIMPLIAGVIVDSKGYLILEIVFLVTMFISLSCALVLWAVDSSRGGELNMSAAARKRQAELKSKQA